MGRKQLLALFSCLLFVSGVCAAQTSQSIAPTASTAPDASTIASAVAPDTDDLPSAPGLQDQTAQQGKPNQQEQTKPGNALSLRDLGFTPQQMQANARMQATLDKRTHMLKVHQTLGLITVIPMVATLITGPQAKAKGKNGETITEPNARIERRASSPLPHCSQMTANSQAIRPHSPVLSKFDFAAGPPV
jgi:flagellar motor protein MotB